MRHLPIFFVGFLFLAFSGVLLAENSYPPSYADARAPILLTSTALPTGISPPIDNQMLTINNPLPLADISPEAITRADIPQLEVQTLLADGEVYQLEFSRDGQLLGGFSGELEQYLVWDMTTREVVAALDVYNSSAHTRGIFSPDGNYVAFYNYPTPGWIEVWEIATATRVRQYQGGTEVIAIGFRADGQEMCALRDRSYQIWNFADGSLIDNQPSPSQNVLYPASATCHAVLRWVKVNDNTITTGNLLDNTQQTYVFSEELSYLPATRFSPYNNYMTVNSAFAEETLLINLDEPATIQKIPYKVGVPWTIAWRADETILILATLDNTLVFWDVLENEVIDIFEDYHSTVSFAPDGTYIVAGTFDATTGEAHLQILAPN